MRTSTGLVNRGISRCQRALMISSFQAQDIPGIEPDNLDSGQNYAQFLQLIRTQLPSNVSLSMALPASYWYLKGFHPIAQFNTAVVCILGCLKHPLALFADIFHFAKDYYVYMTYDMHGQWDYNNSYVNPGCPNGNCLRSHVNKTEIGYALAMLTKAGVKSTQIVPGLALYGRAFQMTDAACMKPECTFTGPQSGAAPGQCTKA
jgi:chitinase